MAKMLYFPLFFGDLDCVETGVSEEGINSLKTLPKSSKLLKKKKLFVALPWVETSTGPGGFMNCVFFYYMTGTPECSTESCFMEKPGIEPATPDLQGIGAYPLHHGGFSIK